MEFMGSEASAAVKSNSTLEIYRDMYYHAHLS